jgi:hypothetical protein
VSPSKTVKHPPRGSAALDGNGSRPRNRSYPSRSEAIDRLEKLRSVVPVFAQELVNARRQAAWLRADNGRLLQQVRQLQRGRAQSNSFASLPTS